MNQSPLDILNFIAQVIYDKKGINIIAYDVKGLSTITDYLLIAEGNVDRHVIAIGQAIIEETKELGFGPILSEGLRVGEWVVVDFGFAMVHIFGPGLRERYSLDRLWTDSKLIDLKIDTSKVVTPSHSVRYKTI